MTYNFEIINIVIEKIINKVKQFAIENNITLLFNAPYSPIFNPIELIFNTIKKNFKELNHDNIEDDINNSIKEAYNIKIQKLYDHCWEHIIKYKNTIIFSKYFNLKKLKYYYNKKIIFLNILCILIYIFNFYEKIIFFCKLIIYNI